MTRIVAGRLGGRVLRVPGKGTRPTSDRVREAIFSRLEHADALDGARVLDLFAGSGALGIEAVSRGASRADLVDSGRDTVRVARQNVRALGLESVVVVHHDKAHRYLDAPPVAPWDVVFLDPPYDLSTSDVSALLDVLAHPGYIEPYAVVVVERSARDGEPQWPDGWMVDACKDYGQTRVYFAGPDDPGAAD